jgi:hypothetical protein
LRRAWGITGGVLALLLATAPAASAGDPILPLNQVQPGMVCEGRSVVRGTEISSFDVEVIDVLRGGPAYLDRILVRVSGPAVDATGIGPGFSGSPIFCPGPSGPANAGAISEGVGEYGNKVALATPIEEILREPAEAPAAAVASAHHLREVRSLAAPLTFSGLTPAFARIVRAAAKRAGRELVINAAAAGPSYPVQDLVPGSAVAVSLSSGAFASGGVGTVAYRDADRVWAFGHPFEGVGARGLFLQDAYVYTVINNPLGFDLTTYKLAVPGHNTGTVLTDGISAVVGRIGALPSSTRVTVNVQDTQSGETTIEETQVADETSIGLPGSLSFILPFAVGDSGFAAVRGAGGDVSGVMCMHFRLRERPKEMRVCNPYFGDRQLPGIVQTQMAVDAENAAFLADELTTRRPFHVESIDTNVILRRGARLLELERARGPKRVLRGSRIRVRATARAPRSKPRTFSFKVKVPRDLRPGSYRLLLSGGGEGELFDFFEFAGPGGFERVFGALLSPADEEESGEGEESEPKPITTPREFEKQLGKLHRFPGIRARFLRVGRGDDEEEEAVPEELLLELLFGEVDLGESQSGQRVYRDPVFGFGGAAALRLKVVKPPRAIPH